MSNTVPGRVEGAREAVSPIKIVREIVERETQRAQGPREKEH